MPTATQAEALVGITEVVDGLKPLDLKPTTSLSPSAIGDAIRARRETRHQLPPLGPPDMLYVRKRYVPVVGAPKVYGYYHFMRGVAPSSVAKISTYIVDVVVNNGLDPQSWVSTGAYEVVSATFLSFNIMARADLVVHVDLPGSTSAEAFDASGKSVPLTDRFWHQLHVSSAVRDFAKHGELPLYPCLRVPRPSFSLTAEVSFFEAAAQCVNDWPLSGAAYATSINNILDADGNSSDQHGDDSGADQDDHDGETSNSDYQLSPRFSTVSPAKSRIAVTIRDHLLSYCRYEAAIVFFTQDQIFAADPQCALHAAAAARKAGDLQRASTLVDSVLHTCSRSDIAWLERAYIYRARGELTEALEAARTAKEYADDDIFFWSAIADLQVDVKQYGDALQSLNNADMPPPALDPFLRVLLRERNSETSPVEGNAAGTDAVYALAKRLREERNFTSERTDDGLTELPAKLMADVDHACYSVLVKILNDLTWDRMLAIRGESFVMETDIENETEEDENINNGETGNGNMNPTAESPSDSDERGFHEISNGLTSISLDQENDDSSSINTVAGSAISSTTPAEAPNGSVGAASSEITPNATPGEKRTPATASIGSSVTSTESTSEGVVRSRRKQSNDGSAIRERKLNLEKTGKKVCKPWLDYLVTNMYNDLRAMALWTAEEQHQAAAASLATAAATSSSGTSSSTVRKSRASFGGGGSGGESSSIGPTNGGQQVHSSDVDVEAPESPGPLKRSADAIASTTQRPSADWLRRGELALRLGKQDDARTAYLVCVKTAENEKKIAVTALIRLMTMSSNDADLRATIRYADAVWNFMDATTDRKTTSEPSPAIADVRKAIFKLISMKGLGAVRELLTNSGMDVNGKRFEGLLLDAVALRVDGFSR